MMAAVGAHATTVALVYQVEEFVRRNRIREKLQARGFKIKKEYQAESKTFDFSTVNLVIVLTDNCGSKNRSNIERHAEAANVRVVSIMHQSSSWAHLDEYAASPANDSTFLRLAAPDDAAEQTSDEDVAALAAMYAEEAAELRKREQKLTGELGNVRADRERLTRDVERLHGQVRKLEADVESARLGAGEKASSEVAKQLEASRRALAEVKGERDAALDANRLLVKERDAAREAVGRSEDFEETIQDLQRDRDRLKDERDKAKTAAKMATAREQMAWNQANEAKAAAEVAIKKLKTAPAAPAVAPKKNLSDVATALRTLVKAGAMKESEAFDKLVEAAK